MNIYGKFKDGELIYLREGETFKTDDGVVIFTSNPSSLLKYGWKKIVYTSPELTAGFRLAGSTWQEEAEVITQVWNYEEVEEIEEEVIEDTEPSIEERLAAVEAAILEMIMNG